MYTPPKKSGPRRNVPQYTGKMRLLLGDTVRVLTGKDKGKEGKITEVKRTEGKVVVEGLNVVIKHQKPRSAGAPGAAGQGGRIEQSMPFHACSLLILPTARLQRALASGSTKAASVCASPRSREE